ncbi:protein vreteno-like [Drosophila pseudoobscura]|uniref:Protein vreteno-like n=1 Tax=Drosophila pseudoobscura pseudoobscura TaxID=46245 RepID=A0A6I8UZP0_DROPS|nr:protein vreteno [Drosophila pseudoobscura]
MDKLLEDWSNWNPMALDYSNNYDDESGQNVVEKAQVPLKPSDMRKIKQTGTANAEYPYLVLSKKIRFISTCSVLNFFGQSHVRSIDFKANSDRLTVFFNDLGSLEAAHCQLEEFPLLLQLQRSRIGGGENAKPMVSAANQLPEPALVPTARGPIDLKSRTIQTSASANMHPEFIVMPIVDSTSYKYGSLLPIRDVEKRYKSVKFEHNLERHGAYILEKQYEEEMLTKPLIEELRFGRKFLKNTDVDDVDEDDNEWIDMSGYEKCVACNGYTSTVCKICDMPFCDAYCWSIVSQQHDSKCGSGQKVDINDENFKQLIPKSGLPSKNSMVTITAFEQSHIVYVRPADFLSELAYYRVLAEIRKHGKDVPKLAQLPVCGQMVLYKFEGQVVRAMVLNVDNPKDICVVSVDFGSVEYTDPGNLYQCSSYLSELPRYAVPVKLRGVPRRAITPTLRDVMYAMQGSSTTFKLRYHRHEYDHKNKMQIAVLWCMEENRNINSLLKKVITPVEPALNEPGINENFLPHVAEPPGKNIYLIVTDNSFLKYGIIYCTPVKLGVEITKMQLAFQDYGENIAKAVTYAPPKGQLCVAKYMGKWCRGVSIELVGDGYPSILFLDYGNIVPTHVTDIRAYPQQLTYPVLTTEYVLIGVPEILTDAQVKRLENHFALGAYVSCDEIVKNEENNYSLRFDDLQNILLLPNY